MIDLRPRRCLRRAFVGLCVSVPSLSILLGLSLHAQEHLRCDPPTLAKLPLQLGELAVRRDIDDKCPCRVVNNGQPSSPLNKANGLQNSIKNNFLALANHPKLISIRQMIRLQEKVEIPLNALPRGDRNTLPSPSQRALFKSISLSSGKSFGEGEVVTLIGFVIGARHSNITDGESVNCNESGCAGNDIHIEVAASPLDRMRARGTR